MSQLQVYQNSLQTYLHLNISSTFNPYVSYYATLAFRRGRNRGGTLSGQTLTFNMDSLSIRDCHVESFNPGDTPRSGFEKLKAYKAQGYAQFVGSAYIYPVYSDIGRAIIHEMKQVDDRLINFRSKVAIGHSLTQVSQIHRLEFLSHTTPKLPRDYGMEDLIKTYLIEKIKQYYTLCSYDQLAFNIYNYAKTHKARAFAPGIRWADVMGIWDLEPTTFIEYVEALRVAIIQVCNSILDSWDSQYPLYNHTAYGLGLRAKTEPINVQGAVPMPLAWNRTRTVSFQPLFSHMSAGYSHYEFLALEVGLLKRLWNYFGIKMKTNFLLFEGANFYPLTYDYIESGLCNYAFDGVSWEVKWINALSHPALNIFGMPWTIFEGRDLCIGPSGISLTTLFNCVASMRNASLSLYDDSVFGRCLQHAIDHGGVYAMHSDDNNILSVPGFDRTKGTNLQMQEDEEDSALNFLLGFAFVKHPQQGLVMRSCGVKLTHDSPDDSSSWTLQNGRVDVINTRPIDQSEIASYLLVMNGYENNLHLVDVFRKAALRAKPDIGVYEGSPKDYIELVLKNNSGVQMFQDAL